MPHSFETAAIAALRLHGHGELAAHVERMGGVLRRLGIRHHVRKGDSESWVPNGSSCVMCKAETDEDLPLIHKPDCILGLGPTTLESSEHLAEMLAHLIRDQWKEDNVDNLGDGESLMYMGKDTAPVINVVELAEGLLGLARKA